MIFSCFVRRGAVFFLRHRGFFSVTRGASGPAEISEHPLYPRLAAMPQLLQQPNRLHPPENLFHAFPHALADFVASVPRRVPVDRAATSPLLVSRHREVFVTPQPARANLFHYAI